MFLSSFQQEWIYNLSDERRTLMKIFKNYLNFKHKVNFKDLTDTRKDSMNRKDPWMWDDAVRSFSFRFACTAQLVKRSFSSWNLRSWISENFCLIFWDIFFCAKFRKYDGKWGVHFAFCFISFYELPLPNWPKTIGNRNARWCACKLCV